jgi:hypothetical protein
MSRHGRTTCAHCGCKLQSDPRSALDICQRCRASQHKLADAVEAIGRLSDASTLGALARLIRNWSLRGAADAVGVECQVVVRWVLSGAVPQPHADEVHRQWRALKQKPGVLTRVQAGRPRRS